MPSENGGIRNRSGGMSVSLASPDGRVVGGGVAGLLVATSPVFLTGNQHEQKTKKQKMDSISIVAPTAATPISSSAEMEDPYGQRTAATAKQNLSSPSFRGDNWSSPSFLDHSTADQGFTRSNGTLSVVDPQPSTPSPDLLGDLLSSLAIEGPPAAVVQSEHNLMSDSEGAPIAEDALAIAPVGEQTSTVQGYVQAGRLAGRYGFVDERTRQPIPGEHRPESLKCLEDYTLMNEDAQRRLEIFWAEQARGEGVRILKFTLSILRQLPRLGKSRRLSV